MSEIEKAYSCIVRQERGGFHSLIPVGCVEKIDAAGGLKTTEILAFIGTEEHPIDLSILDGSNRIVDVWISAGISQEPQLN